MDEGLAFFLVLLIGLAAPLAPLAVRTARQAIAGWKDIAIIAGLLAVLLYATWPVYLALMGLLAPLAIPLIPSRVEQGAALIMTAGVGPWLVGMFCLACSLLAHFKRRQ